MSTNYYLKRKHNLKNSQLMQEVIMSGSDEDIKNFTKELTEGIHIGKHMGGWKFAIDANEWKYFNKSIKSYLNWLNEKLVNESDIWELTSDNCIGAEGKDAVVEIMNSIKNSLDGKIYTPQPGDIINPDWKETVSEGVRWIDYNGEWF